MPMMKNSTLFIVKKFNYQSAEKPKLGRKEADNDLIEMEGAVVVPSTQTIRKIMDFARTYNVCKTKSAGHVEMILN